MTPSKMYRNSNSVFSSPGWLEIGIGKINKTLLEILKKTDEIYTVFHKKFFKINIQA